MDSDAVMLDEPEAGDERETGEEQGKESGAEKAALLAKAARLTALTSAGLVQSGYNSDAYKLLHALAELVAEQAEEGNPAPDFHTERIRDRICERYPARAPYWAADAPSAKKNFATAWDDLEKAFRGMRENLLGRSQKAGVPALVTLHDERRARDNFFWLGLERIQLPPTPRARVPDEARVAPERGTITYIEELEVYPIAWVRKPLRIAVQGWRAALLVGPLLGMLAAGLGLLWLLLVVLVSDLPFREIFQWSVVLLFFAGLAGVIGWPLYRLIEDGIVKAPSILEIRLPLGHVLVARREAEGRVVRMVRYVCEECPVCGGLVTIRPGRRTMRGRFVGACERNPIEHVFSFDHVTRNGERVSE